MTFEFYGYMRKLARKVLLNSTEMEEFQLDLKHGSAVSTTICPAEEGLYRVDFLLGTSGNNYPPRSGYLIMGLFELNSATPLRQCVAELSNIEDKKFHPFIFEPLPSIYKNQTLVISLAANYILNPDEVIKIFCTKKMIMSPRN
jgi:hypothetical protein